jgi:hypothetical protein
MLVILAIMVSGVLVVVAAVEHTRRSREKKPPIQLGIGRKLQSWEFRIKRGRS